MLNLIVAAALFLNEPTLRGAHVGFYAVDTATHRVLADVNAGDDFIPASTMKLLVASAALDRLGSAFTFDTSLESAADLDGSTLQGPLVLRGGGDASLDGAAFTQAAAALKARGIATIEGDLIADTSRYNAPPFPPGWLIDDLPYDYAAPVTALAFEDNAVALRVTAGARGSRAAIAPEAIAGMDVRNQTQTRDGDTSIDITRDPLHPQQLTVTGSIAPGAAADEEDAAVTDPPLYALTALRGALATAGITVTGRLRTDVTAPATLLWTRHSAAMPAMLKRFLLPSNNLMGELLLNELGVRSGGNGNTADNGITAERAWLREHHISDAAVGIFDGSGLSVYDRMTPQALVALLQHDWDGSHRSELLDALPLAGVRGTLAHSFTGTPFAGHVYAKTGSMSRVRALAGYWIDGKRTVAFALFVDDWADSGSGASARLDRAREDALSSLP